MGLVLLAGLGWALLRAELGPFVGTVASALLGRETAIGSLRLSLGPTIAVSLAELRIANAPGGSAGDLARLGRLTAGLRLMPLLRGALVFEAVTVERLVLMLERDAAGRGNYVLGTERHDPPDARRIVLPVFTAFDLRDARITWRTSSGAILRVDLAEVAVRAPSLEAPMTLTADGAYQGARIRLTVAGQSLAVLRRPEIPYTATAEATTGDAQVRLSGRFVDPFGFDGVRARLTARAPRLDALLAAGGLAVMADLPLTLDGALAKDGPAWSLTGISGTLMGEDLHGLIRLDEGARGEVDRIATDLTLARLDLTRLRAGLGGGESDRLPVIAARPDTLLEARLAIGATQIGPVALTEAVIHGRLAPGALVIEEAQAFTASGTIQLAGTASAAPTGTMLQGGLRVLGVESGALLGLLGVTRPTLTGRLDLHAALRLTGETLGEAYADSRASAVVAMQGGTVAHDLLEQVSIDLRRLWRDSSGTAPLGCLLGIVDLTNGAGPVWPLRLRADGGEVEGWGEVDLLHRRLDLTVHSRPATTSSFALDVPLRLTGPFDALEIDTAHQAANRTPQTEIPVEGLPADLRRLVEASPCRG